MRGSGWRVFGSFSMVWTLKTKHQHSFWYLFPCQKDSLEGRGPTPEGRKSVIVGKKWRLKPQKSIPEAWGTDGFKRREMPSENFWCWFKLIPWEIVSSKVVWQTFIPPTGPFYVPSTNSAIHFFMPTNSSLFPCMQTGWGKSQITGRKSSVEFHAFHLGVASLNCNHLKDGHWIKWFWYTGKEAGHGVGI